MFASTIPSLPLKAYGIPCRHGSFALSLRELGLFGGGCGLRNLEHRDLVGDSVLSRFCLPERNRFEGKYHADGARSAQNFSATWTSGCSRCPLDSCANQRRT